MSCINYVLSATIHVNLMLEAKELILMNKRTTRAEDKNKSHLIRLKISDWVWNMYKHYRHFNFY